MKGPEDFINGNWRGSNGHEPGQWSARADGQRLPRVPPTFCFSHPVDGQLRTPPQLFRLFDDFRSLTGFYFSYALAISRDNYCSRTISQGQYGPRPGLRKFCPVKNDYIEAPPGWKVSLGWEK